MSTKERLNLFPSRANYVIMKNRLASSNKGLLLLKRKRDALELRLRSLKAELKKQRELCDTSVGEAIFSMARLDFLGTDLKPHSILPVQRADIYLRFTLLKTIGVTIPQFDLILRTPECFPLTGLAHGGSEVEKVRIIFQNALKTIALMASAEYSVKVLEDAVHQNNMRLNGLEYVVIPRLQNTTVYIRDEMEEFEREDFYRLKRSQAKRMKKWKEKIEEIRYKMEDPIGFQKHTEKEDKIRQQKRPDWKHIFKKKLEAVYYARYELERQMAAVQDVEGEEDFTEAYEGYEENDYFNDFEDYDFEDEEYMEEDYVFKSRSKILKPAASGMSGSMATATPALLPALDNSSVITTRDLDSKDVEERNVMAEAVEPGEIVESTVLETIAVEQHTEVANEIPVTKEKSFVAEVSMAEIPTESAAELLVPKEIPMTVEKSLIAEVPTEAAVELTETIVSNEAAITESALMTESRSKAEIRSEVIKEDSKESEKEPSADEPTPPEIVEYLNSRVSTTEETSNYSPRLLESTYNSEIGKPSHATLTSSVAEVVEKTNIINNLQSQTVVQQIEETENEESEKPQSTKTEEEEEEKSTKDKK